MSVSVGTDECSRQKLHTGGVVMLTSCKSWTHLTFWAPKILTLLQQTWNIYEWLTRGWFCGWCPVWRGRGRGRTAAGWVGCRCAPGESAHHPHPAAAAMWGETGCPRTGSEPPEDPSPLALQAHARCTSRCAASRQEKVGSDEQGHTSWETLAFKRGIRVTEKYCVTHVFHYRNKYFFQTVDLLPSITLPLNEHTTSLIQVKQHMIHVVTVDFRNLCCMINKCVSSRYTQMLKHWHTVPWHLWTSSCMSMGQWRVDQAPWRDGGSEKL